MRNDHSTLARIALGAAAGLAGTTAIVGLRSATKRWLPRFVVPEWKDAGEALVATVESRLPRRVRRRVPDGVSRALARSLPLGYGTAPAALFAALRPHARHPLAEGAAFGAALWSAGYLGFLPALGVTPPVRRLRAGQVAVSLAEHALCGIVTVNAYRKLRQVAARDD